MSELLGELLKHVGRFMCGAINKEELITVLRDIAQMIEEN